MTAVVARAQMGKTWLLQQLARDLNEEPHGYLVGYFETYGEGSDALLRTVTHGIRPLHSLAIRR